MRTKWLKQEEVIRRFREAHGDKYDYSRALYKGRYKKMEIGCPIHGFFWQRPDVHWDGHGCPECAREERIGKKIKPTVQFVEDARKVHGDKYDYSLTIYKGAEMDVTIICQEKDENGIEHGAFTQKPVKHLSGQGCPICGKLKSIKARTTTPEDFIRRAREIHGDKYDYSRANFESMNKAVMIGCPIHGYFSQTPSSHIHQRQGCPFCRQSKMEKEVTMLLDKLGIKYAEKKRFVWLGRQHLDVYLTDYDIAIECQGIQHFEPREHFGGEEEFTKTIERAQRKLRLCEEHGVPLYYIRYDESLEERLNEILITIVENNG